MCAWGTLTGNQDTGSGQLLLAPPPTQLQHDDVEMRGMSARTRPCIVYVHT